MLIDVGDENIFIRNSGLKKLERLTEYKDPVRFIDRDEHLRPLFEEIQAHNASDIYIQEGKPIAVLIQGILYGATWRILEKSETQWLLNEIAGKTALSSISSQISINTTFGLFDKDKDKKNLAGYRIQNTYRVNAVGIMNSGIPSFQIVMRAIPSDPYKFNQIGLNEKFVKRCCPPKGIVLIAGVTGSGKSTTLASIIRYILEENTPIKGNIITHEEPIEFTYDNIVSHHSIVVQSQIPECFKNFGAANREAMRRKPAAILVGELRDRETISSAVEASLTGHPVFATVHSSAITEIIPRLIAQYPTDEKENALFDIISTVVMLVAQRLVRKANGKLMAVQEYFYFTDEIRAELLRISNPIDINRRIHEFMQQGVSDEKSPISPTFNMQAEKLLSEGVIANEGYNYLRSSLLEDEE